MTNGNMCAPMAVFSTCSYHSPSLSLSLLLALGVVARKSDDCVYKLIKCSVCACRMVSVLFCDCALLALETQANAWCGN